MYFKYFNVVAFCDSKTFIFFSESKTTNDFFKTELSYDAVADPASFVKDIFPEEETVSQVPEHDSPLADTMKQENENCEIENKIVVEYSDKPQVDVRKLFIFFSIFF